MKYIKAMKRIFFVALYLFITSPLLFAQLPIKVERTISFTTDEGSNMSVDLSPDGKTIVFDLLGDLYTLPSKGGNATQITRGIAVNSYPVWSPKGDKIAYLSDASGDKRLTVMNVSGNNHQTFNERAWRAPVWIGTDGWLISPRPNDGFMTFPLYHLSGVEVQLPKDIYDIVGSSADGKLIYYKQKSESGGWSVFQYDTSTGTKKILTELQKKGAEGLKVSHDTRLLSYFVREGVTYSLILVDISTKKEQLLAKWDQNVEPYSFLEKNYNFSWDCKQIIVGYGGKIHMIELETGKDEVVPFKVEVKVDMGKLNDARFNLSQDSLKVKYMRSAQASPDGKHLVFAALNRIYIMDLPNGKPRILVSQPFNQFHPAWSPNGNQIVFVSWSDENFGQVWKVNVNGSGLTQVTQKVGSYHYPSWSPDGQSIVVNQAIPDKDGRPMLIAANSTGKLLSVDLKDRKIEVITDSISVINKVVYTADGKSFVYKPDIRTSHGKYLISVNNKFEKKTLAVAAGYGSDELTFRQIALSPDGKYMVYTSEENLHLIPVAPTGTPTILDENLQKLPIIRFARGGIDPQWAQSGKVLNWSFANQYFEIDPDKIVAEAIKSAQQRVKLGLALPNILDVYINPDKAITIDLRVPQKIGNGLLALKNVRIISMKDTEVIQKATVLIKDGRFLAVGEVEDVKIPYDAKVIDLTGKTIMPGMIDLHDHVGPLLEIFPQQKFQFLTGLAYGATTVRDPATGPDSFGFEELLATGQMTGPRYFDVGRPVRGYYTINNLEDARNVVQTRALMGGVVVKQYTLPTRLKRQLLLLACEEAGLNMTNEVEKNNGGFIGHIKDGTAGVEHNPYWGEAYNDVIQLTAKSGVYLTATLQVAYGTQIARNKFIERYARPDAKMNHFYPASGIKGRQEELEKLKIYIEAQEELPSFLNQSKIDAAIRHAGGRVTMGSHGEDPGLGAHFETWALQMGGLSNLEALQAATIMAAGALGMQNDLGSIEPGKIADLIILNKNPLDDIKNTMEIQSVMKDGVLYDGDTLDEIWPVKKKFNYTKSGY